jgi:hypothetical protein
MNMAGWTRCQSFGFQGREPWILVTPGLPGEVSTKGTMKNKLFAVLALTLVCAINSPLTTASAQGTAFTYQGRLNNGGAPASGLYDYRFKLYADPLGNTQVGSAYLTNGIPVTNGLFITAIDFGPGIFTGGAGWLGVEVRPNGTSGYTELSPLQSLTPTPYAIYAGSTSNLLGVLPASQLPVSPSFSGTVTAGALAGNGATVTNVNAAALNGLTAASFWQLGGNNVSAGKFLGSTNNQPVELWVDNIRALRLEPGGASGLLMAYGLTNFNGAPNVIGGASVNYVSNSVVGAAIGGGGTTNYEGLSLSNSVSADFGTVGGGVANLVYGPEGTVGGGYTNTAGNEATVGGGAGNAASGQNATVAGGANNIASGQYATVGGGTADVASLTGATVGGGSDNQATSLYATVPGGLDNVAGGYGSFAAGYGAQALGDGTFVWADNEGGGMPFYSTGANQFLIRAQGGVGINTNDPAGAALSVSGTVSATTLLGNSLGLGTAPGQPVDVLAGQATARFTTSTSGNGSVVELKNITSGPGILGAINFNNAANGYPGQIAYSSGNTMSFRVAGNNSMMVLTSSALTVNGTFVSSSDRNLKQDFQAVDSRSVLEKVSQLPVQTWVYKNDPGTKHLGPMAQDFYAAFGTGADDRHIAVVDEGGVALAAIQGLNQKLDEKDAEIEKLKAKADQVDALEQELDELKQQVQSIAARK